MNNGLNLWGVSCAFLHKQVEGLYLEEINRIPNGFKNNIAWNVAHIAATQQILCYKLSALPYVLPLEFIELYKKGTQPTKEITQTEWKQILAYLSSIPKKIEEDYKQHIFQEYESYLTSHGYELNNIDQAIDFNNVHTALHVGYVMALKKVL